MYTLPSLPITHLKSPTLSLSTNLPNLLFDFFSGKIKSHDVNIISSSFFLLRALAASPVYSHLTLDKRNPLLDISLCLILLDLHKHRSHQLVYLIRLCQLLEFSLHLVVLAQLRVQLLSCFDEGLQLDLGFLKGCREGL